MYGRLPLAYEIIRHCKYTASFQYVKDLFEKMFQEFV